MLFYMNSNHSFEKIIDEIASPDRLMVAIIAVLMAGVVGIITGPLASNANPYFWALFDRIMGNTARKAYIKEKSLSALIFRGTFFTIAFVLLAAVFGAVLYMLKRAMPMGGFTEPFLLSLLCTSGAVIVSVYRLYLALNRDQASKDDRRGSFAPVAVTAKVDLNSVDEFGSARMGAGLIPVLFDRGMVTPIFWYLIGGLPLAFLVTGILTAKWALAKNGFAKGYAVFAGSLEIILGFIPRVISSFLFILSAVLTPHAGITRSISSLFAFKEQAPALEGGLPLTITAYALNASLGGAVQDVDGSALPQKFVGPAGATAKVDAAILKQACYLGGMAHLLFLALLLGLLMLMTATAPASVPMVVPPIGG